MNHTESKVSATIDLFGRRQAPRTFNYPTFPQRVWLGGGASTDRFDPERCRADDASNRRQSWRRIRGTDRPDETG